jgi:hypothetical protein
VVREIPNRPAIRAFGTPSAASLLINAQSSKVITLQSSSVHFSSVVTVQFSSVVDTKDGTKPRPNHPDQDLSVTFSPVDDRLELSGLVPKLQRRTSETRLLSALFEN